MSAQQGVLRRFIAFKNREEGMSLIEVAIAMVILGILLSGILATYRIYQKTKAEKVTAEHQALIEEAIGTFFSINGSYPKPQGFRIREGENGYGRQADEVAVQTAACGGVPADNRVCRVGAAGSQVYIGSVPFQDLNMPAELTLDGYGRRFTYAVTRELTLPNAGTGVFAICMNRQTVAADGSISTINCNTPDTFMAGNPLNEYEDIAIISHGRNGRGAWTVDGVPYLTCPSAAEGADSENCNYDSTFVRSRASEAIRVDTNNDGTLDGMASVLRAARIEAAGANYNDDVISVDIRESSNFWSLVPSGTDYIKNRGDLHVGIGIQNPTRPLEVEGSLKANLVQATNLCTDGGTECMETEAIAGDLAGMKCDTAGYMSGVANNKVYCEQMVPEFTCDSNHVIVGIDADGKPICQNHANPTECVATVQKRNKSCPAGQVGNIEEQRQLSCPANTWSAWAQTANTCAAHVAPCAVKPPEPAYGICTQRRSGSTLTTDWYCCKGTEGCRTVTCQPAY